MGGMPPGGGPAEGGPCIIRPGIGWTGPIGPAVKKPLNASFFSPLTLMDSCLTRLSWEVLGHGVVTHWGVAGVHGSPGWGPSVVGRWCSVMGGWPSVVRWGPSEVHAWRRVSRVGSGSRGLSLPLGLCGCRSSSLLLHLLPRLHLSIFELLHVEGLPLGEQLLPLELQLQRHPELIKPELRTTGSSGCDTNATFKLHQITGKAGKGLENGNTSLQEHILELSLFKL